MLQPTQVEELITLVCSLDRDALVREMKRYDTRFPVDFTPEFLREQPIDRLRHIFVAMCLHCQRVPAPMDESVAA
jgi:hypothetical protein